MDVRGPRLAQLLVAWLALAGLAASAAAQVVHGQLVDVDGAALVGVEVRLVEHDRATRPVPDQGDTNALNPPRRLVVDPPLRRAADASTDEDGRGSVDLARLAGRGRDGELSLARHEGWLVFSQAGLGTLVRALPEPQALGDAGTDTLLPGGEVVGRVVDAEGRPRPGARLVFFSADRWTPAGARGDGPSTRSRSDFLPEVVHIAGIDTAVAGPDGRYRFADLAPGFYRPVVRQDDASPLGWRDMPAWKVLPGEVLRAEDIVLAPGRPVRVMLRDAEGHALEGAHVMAADDPVQSGGSCVRIPFLPDDDPILYELSWWGHSWVDDAVTSPDGRCTLGGFPADAEVTLYALADGCEPIRLVLPPDASRDVTLHMRPWAELEVVVRRDDGTALPEGVELRAVRIASAVPERSVATEHEDVVPWSRRLRNIELLVDDLGGGVFRVTRCGTIGTGLVLTAPGCVPVKIAAPGLQPGERGRLELTLAREPAR